MMTTILYEHRAHPKRSGSVKLVTLAEALAKGGFMSVHGYIPAVAEAVQAQRGTFNLDRVPLYLDRVILDFDDAEEAYEAARTKCEAQGWGYTAYHTGNRGYHLYIPIEPVCELGVNRRAARWVAQHFKGYDDSMYKTSSITRIPGTYHAKTGKPMVEVGRSEGAKPDIKMGGLALPVPVYVTRETGEEDLAGNFAVALRRSAAEGGRNQYAFRLFAAGVELGVGEEELWSLVTRWNDTRCEPPLSQKELMTTLKSAQRKVTRA